MRVPSSLYSLPLPGGNRSTPRRRGTAPRSPPLAAPCASLQAHVPVPVDRWRESRRRHPPRPVAVDLQHVVCRHVRRVVAVSSLTNVRRRQVLVDHRVVEGRPARDPLPSARQGMGGELRIGVPHDVLRHVRPDRLPHVRRQGRVKRWDAWRRTGDAVREQADVARPNRLHRLLESHGIGVALCPQCRRETPVGVRRLIIR